MRRVVVYNFLVIMLVYLSTPYIKIMGLSGNLDAFCVGLLVVGVCQFCLIAGRNSGALLAALVICLVLVFNIGSKFYLDQQQYYLSMQTFYLVTEILSPLASHADWKLVLGGTILAASMCAFVHVARQASFNNKFLSLTSSSVLVASVFALQVVYAGITREEVFDSSEATPVGHLIRSSGVLPFVVFDHEWMVDQERKSILNKMLADPTMSFPEKYSLDTIYASLGRKLGLPLAIVDPKYPIYTRTIKEGNQTVSRLEAKKQYNVVVLVLESVRASEMGVYGSSESATPFLDSLARKNIFASKFYATSNFTVKSEHAINCSIYDFMIGAPVSKRGMPVRTKCLPEMLAKEKNYRTLWFHGNDKGFYNRGEYLPKLGFQEVYSAKELNDDGQRPVLGWGISDPVLFDIALDKLASIEGPFYSEILSVSNHMAFDYDWGIEFPLNLVKQTTMFERYRRGIYYTDQAVKSFYKKFEESSLFDNTILVITGDHGIWTFSDDRKSGLTKNEEFFRVPLIMTIPDRERIRVEGTHSHLDIAPTLLDIMGIELDNAFVGQSIFSKSLEKSNRALYLMTEQALSYRFKNKVCIPSVQCQNNINCYNNREATPASTQCYAIDDDQDLLLGAEGLTSDGSTVSSSERALFDYAQMALELGTAPQFRPTVNFSAALGE